MAKETVYIKPSESCTVYHPHINIGDVMKVESSDVSLMRKIKQMNLYQFSHEHGVVFSVMIVIQRILKEYPNVDVVNCGEQDFIVEYVKSTVTSALWNRVKLILVATLVFFGSAFTIMSFHNDIDIQGVFDRFYMQLMGKEKHMVSELEISYAIGIGTGIIIFYNHFSKKRLTKDPTPIEVELKKYTQDLNSAKVDMADEKGHKVDVT